VDERMRLIFRTCHPALAPEARLALALHVVTNASIGDLARAFRVSRTEMARLLRRAERRIARLQGRTPAAHRLPCVLAALYLMFTLGYNTESGPAYTDEALRLVRLLEAAFPGEPEIPALLALFLFQHSRRHARRTEAGELITLDRQDRGDWDAAAIDAGLRALTRTTGDGPYALQARIAAGHATAVTADATDWVAIARLFDALLPLQPSLVVRLNRAVAHGYAYGARDGLALLSDVRAAGGLDDCPLVFAAEAELTLRAGDRHRAAALFRQAAQGTAAGPERQALLNRAEDAYRR
jgi:RNA polymerase sigma-70 factor (ECF subfamily)